MPVRKLNPAPPKAHPTVEAAPPAPAPLSVVEPRPEARRRERRGPLRPERLASVRERHSGRGLAVTFRAVDTIAVMTLAWLLFDVQIAQGLLQSPFAHGAPFLIGGAAAVIGLRACKAYDFTHSETLSRHLIKVAAPFFIAGVVALGLLRLLAPEAALLSEAGLWCAAAFIMTYGLHVWWWAIVRDWRKRGRLTPNIVIVGATENAERLIDAALASRDVAVLGVFDDRIGRVPDQIRGVPLLGDTSALLDHRVLPFVDRIVITVPPSAQSRVRVLIERLQVLPNAVTLLLDDGFTTQKTLSRLADAPLTLVSGRPEDETRAAVKRGADVVLGALALVALSPVLAVTALAVRLDSPGPVLFKQRRHGFNNEEILVWKFRSMRHEPAVQAVAGVRQVKAGDDRVTRVGRFIRKTSLDELPQLWNVLRGEMSLVGPRPHPVNMQTGSVQSHKLVAEYAHRHRMKPGVTGWAAINGSRGPVDTPELVRRRVALDVEYIERQSFWFDLYIMLMTVPRLLGDGEAVR